MSAVPFDRKNAVGLHHLAFSVDGADALNALHDKLLGTGGVDVEFAPEPLGGGPAKHMMCAIPGGIRVEFIAGGWLSELAPRATLYVNRHRLLSAGCFLRL